MNKTLLIVIIIIALLCGVGTFVWAMQLKHSKPQLSAGHVLLLAILNPAEQPLFLPFTALAIR